MIISYIDYNLYYNIYESNLSFDIYKYAGITLNEI